MRSVLLALAFFALSIQVHGPKPPDDWFCTHDKAAPTDHQCECKRMCVKDEHGENVVVEDTACKAYCHKEHCTCPTGCKQLT